jgi:Flp pilus assembly pilin Flp
VDVLSSGPQDVNESSAVGTLIPVEIQLLAVGVCLLLLPVERDLEVALFSLRTWTIAQARVRLMAPPVSASIMVSFFLTQIQSRSLPTVAVRSLPRDPSVKLMPTGVVHMLSLIAKLWLNDEGQDIAEYAVMLAVILVLVVGTIRLVGSNANNAFSSVASSLQ